MQMTKDPRVFGADPGAGARRRWGGRSDRRGGGGNWAAAGCSSGSSSGSSGGEGHDPPSWDYFNLQRRPTPAVKLVQQENSRPAHPKHHGEASGWSPTPT